MNESRSWNRPLRHARVIPSVSKLSSRQQQSTRRPIVGLLRLQVDAATIRVEFDWIVIVKPFFPSCHRCRRVSKGEKNRRRKRAIKWWEKFSWRVEPFLPLNRWYLVVHNARQSNCAADFHMDLCWANDFSEFYCTNASRKEGEREREKELNALMSNLLNEISHSIRLCVRGLSGSSGRVLEFNNWLLSEALALSFEKSGLGSIAIERALITFPRNFHQVKRSEKIRLTIIVVVMTVVMPSPSSMPDNAFQAPQHMKEQLCMLIRKSKLMANGKLWNNCVNRIYLGILWKSVERVQQCLHFISSRLQKFFEFKFSTDSIIKQMQITTGRWAAGKWKQSIRPAGSLNVD